MNRYFLTITQQNAGSLIRCSFKHTQICYEIPVVTLTLDVIIYQNRRKFIKNLAYTGISSFSVSEPLFSVMSIQLKDYKPTEKGRELIALLFPLSHREREKNMLEYWKQYPLERNALLDGFHYLVQELVEVRNAGVKNDIINFPADFVEIIAKQMVKEKNYFSYDNGKAFFDLIEKVDPPIVKDVEIFKTSIDAALNEGKPKKKASSLPEHFDEATREKLKSVCKAAQDAYDSLSRIQRSLRNSQILFEQTKKGEKQVSKVELDLAKETFLESKKIFVDNGKVIANGMGVIYQAYQSYPDEIIVKKIYMKYLAKLLGSREARYPPEAYVLSIANGDFDFTEPSFEPTDRELQHGKTKYSIKKEFINKLNKHINRLEARYRKRKLTVMLKSDTPRTTIIKELEEILRIDPSDIRTHIFLAKLLAEYSNNTNNHVKKGAFREQALKHCQAAFSKIDDYLDLQNMDKMKDRDVARAGFVKTISAIRIPLIRTK